MRIYYLFYPLFWGLILPILALYPLMHTDNTINDTTPPTLISWDIAPSRGNVGLRPIVITVTASFTDETGLEDGKNADGQWVSVSRIKFSNGNNIRSIDFRPPGALEGNLVSGTAKNGVYQDVIVFDSSQVGGWGVSFVGVDELGNTKNYNLYAEGFYSGTVPIYTVNVYITDTLNYLPIWYK